MTYSWNPANLKINRLEMNRQIDNAKQSKACDIHEIDTEGERLLCVCLSMHTYLQEDIRN